MKILDAVISGLNFTAPVREIRQGFFQTAVWTRYCGLAATVCDDDRPHGESAVPGAGLLRQKNPAELVNLAYSASLLEASIGMATINSLLETDKESCEELNAADLLAEKGMGKKVAIIGHFPFVTRLRPQVGQLWVIEKKPRGGDFAEEAAAELLPRADVVGITGTAFTNHTIAALLELCRAGAYVVVLGGTAPLSPVLFDYGVAAICGVRVEAPETVLDYVSQGAILRQMQGIRLLTMRKR